MYDLRLATCEVAGAIYGINNHKPFNLLYLNPLSIFSTRSIFLLISSNCSIVM